MSTGGTLAEAADRRPAADRAGHAAAGPPGHAADGPADRVADDHATGAGANRAADPRKDLGDELRRHGLRVTAPRLAVLAAVERLPHADAAAVLDDVRGALGTVSVQAVYDVLGTLTDRGLVRRIEPAGHPARYERRRGDNHHHVVCERCGAVADVDCAVGEAPCLTPSQTHGFEIRTAEVTYWGLCPDCGATAAAPPPTARP